MMTEAIPSNTGITNLSAAGMQIAATAIPRSAAVSSNNTVKAGGSLLSTAACQYPRRVNRLTEHRRKVIVANDAVINKYRDGGPDNGKPFPDGSKIAKIEWSFKKNTPRPPIS
jgi:hypothetical protein